MARRKQNLFNDILDGAGAWLGGNRGSVPSSGAGAAWQASARSAAQSSNRRIVKGLEEGVVQFGALGMGTSAQTQRDLMYGVPGAGNRALKEAAVSQVTGLAAGAVAAKTAQVAGRAVAKTGIPARVANKLTGQTVIVHSSPVKGLKTIEPRVAPAAPDHGARVFGARPSNRTPAYDYEAMARIGRHYVSERSAQIQTKLGKRVTGYGGSMYVAKVRTKTLEGSNAYVRSPSPAKVIEEIPISGPMPFKNSIDPEDVRKLERAFRRAGGRPVKAPKESKVKKITKPRPTRS